MAVSVDVRPRLLEQIANLRKALLEPQPILRKIGALSVETSRQSFADQKLGDFVWPARYEGMEDPFINIAGAVQDWIVGRANPKPNRFQDRPALIDERNLRDSITYRVTHPDQVEIGSNMEYAKVHQEGGESSQPLDKATKGRIWDWLNPLTKKGKKVGKKSPKRGVLTHGRSGKEAKQGTAKDAYRRHIEPLLYLASWDQRIAQRPFLGFPTDLQHDIVKATQDHFANALRKPPKNPAIKAQRLSLFRGLGQVIGGFLARVRMP